MKRALYAFTALSLIAAAFVAVNLLAARELQDLRVDLTEERLYSISEGTRSVLANLDEPINLYFFYSNRSGTQQVPLRGYARRVEELLKAYERQARGKIVLHIIDPQPFSDEEERATTFGLQPLPQEPGAAPVYFGLAGTDALDGVQVIPVFQPDQERFLEYDLSRLVQALAHPRKSLVGVMSTLPVAGGSDENSQTAPWGVLEQVAASFEIKPVAVDATRIPEDVGVLMLIHPRHLSDATLYAIDQFVLRGGKLLAFVDPFSEVDRAIQVSRSGGKEEASEQTSDLGPLMKAWGVSLLSGQVIGDATYAMSVNLGEGQRPVHHPGWLSLDAGALDAADVTTAGLSSLNLATPGGLVALPGATTRFTVLAHSSNLAMAYEAKRFIGLSDPGELMGELKPAGQPFTFVARLQGPAGSAFPGGVEGQPNGLSKSDNINVILVADTDLLTDRMWREQRVVDGVPVARAWADNATFVVNALDNLSSSDALIGARPRGRYSRPFSVVQTLLRQAETRWREQENLLKQHLAETERQLSSLQSSDAAGGNGPTPEQQVTIAQFNQERMHIRRQLREVQFQLNTEIDALGQRLKVFNILLVPGVLMLLGLVAHAWRRRRHR